MRGPSLGGLSLLLVLAAPTVCGCGSSSSGGSSPAVTCGPGTVLDGSVCYVEASVTADDGGADTAAPPSDASDGGGQPIVEGGPDSTAEASGPEPDAATTSPAFAGVTSAGPASATSLQITWGPATDAVSPASEIVYDVYVSTKAGGETFSAPTVTSPPGALSVLVSGLTSGTTYYVVVRAKNQAKLEDTNTVETTGVPAADTSAPAFGGGSDANPSSQGGITVTWAAAIDDLSPTQGIGYFIYMSTTMGGEDFTVPSYVTDPGATSYDVPALPQPGATYYFVVRAHDAAGNTDANTAEVSAVPGVDTIAPVFAGCTSALTLNSTQVTVTWDPATDNTTPASQIAYDVFAAQTSGQEVYTTPAATFTGGSVGVVTGLKQNTSYYFVCRAKDLSGNEDQNKSERIATTPVDTTPPTFGGLTGVTNVTATGATLAWAAASDPQTPTAQIVYDVFQTTSAGGENFNTPSATSTPGATSIDLTNLPPSSTVYWVVRARDLAGNEDTNTIELNATTGVSFAENVQPIFSQHCAVVGCHVPGNPPEGQVLSAGFAFSNIVSVASKEVTTDDRVAPGDLSHSYLYLKITAQQSIGSVMPPPSTNDVLMSSEVETIKDWIVQGALNN